jgi:hypothetical protein
MRTARRLLVGDIGLALLSCLGASVAGAITLRLWRADLSIPIRYGYDATQILGYVQNVIETGWYLNAPRLGAPFGQSYQDFPLGAENLHFLLIRVLAALTGDAPATVTLFYLLTFPLIALTAFWALRQLGVVGPVAVFGAIVYAVAPFHFLRSTGHLLLAAYYGVPLACFVLVKTLEGHPLFGLGADPTTPERHRRSRWVAVLGAVALAWIIASSAAYFAAFTLMLLLPATLIGWLHTRTRAIVASGALMATLIVAFLALNNAPTFLYWAQNGGNPDVPIRGAMETPLHQLRPITLLVPIPGHRLAPLADFTSRYFTWRTGEWGDPMGMLGAVGFVGLIVVALGSLVGFFKNGRTWSREKRLAALTLIAVALTTSGGISTLVALELTTQIRAWARISIFISFFALLAVALLLTLGWRWAHRRGWRIPAAVALVGLLGLVVVEQTSSFFIPPYETIKSSYIADQTFVSSIEASLPTGAAIYMLPYRQYPEAGSREKAVDYDNLKPYLHSDQLRFSYGGMKGREAGWETYVYGRPPADALPLVYLAGFSAVWVDRYAYSDGGSAVEQAIRSVTQAEPTVSADGRISVFDIRAVGERLTSNLVDATRADLESRFRAPIWLRWRSGAQRASIGGDGRITRPVERSSALALVNDGPERPVTVSLQIESLVGSRPISIVWPDGFTQSVTAGPTAPISRTVLLPSGESRVEINLDGPVGPEGASARIHDLWALDPELVAVEASLAPP